MIDSYHIRLALPQDTAFLPSIERQAAKLFENWLGETGLTLEALARVNSVEDFDHAQRAGRLWVAVSPLGELVGFVLVLDLGGMPHIEELDVLPEHGGRGLGSRLLEEVCGWAREAGYPKVTLSTFRDVPWNAPFYQRHGFRIVEAAELSEQHVQLVRSEKERGLRTDLRVVMEYIIQAG
jgi:4-diphosphocytidyl-2-C-methyl-D-erythritol kinase